MPFYKTDLHCHTSEGSVCAEESTEATIEKYISYGFTSIALTNHLENYRIGAPEGSHTIVFATYGDYIDFIYDKIDLAREIAGERINILNGFELRNNESENDYLVYGLTRQMAKDFDLVANPLKNSSEYIRCCGGVIIQAHPMRLGMTQVDHELVDGYEVFNNTRHWMYTNILTQMWVQTHCFDKTKILTAGNDHHDPDQLPEAGILTSEPIVTDADLIRVLKSRDFSIFHPTRMNGGDW